jgi:hypothetical protein
MSLTPELPQRVVRHNSEMKFPSYKRLARLKSLMFRRGAVLNLESPELIIRTCKAVWRLFTSFLRRLFFPFNNDS